MKNILYARNTSYKAVKTSYAEASLDYLALVVCILLKKQHVTVVFAKIIAK